MRCGVMLLAPQTFLFSFHLQYTLKSFIPLKSQQFVNHDHF